MDKTQLRDLITRVLNGMEHLIPYSVEATELLMMIAAHESHLGHYLKQKQGPALGLFQIEPDTEVDMFISYIGFREELSEFVSSVLTESSCVPDMEGNLIYQIVMARIQLYRKPGKLPKDSTAMAEYAKEHWNTVLGKATSEDYLKAYNELAK